MRPRRLQRRGDARAALRYEGAMTAFRPRPAPCLLALLLLAACGGPRGDWRRDYGALTPNPVVLVPAQPLAVPPELTLPPPGGANRATPGR